MLNIKDLPREVRDRIELREQTDQTFHRFVDCVWEMTPVFCNRGWVRMRDLVVGDEVLGESSQKVSIKSVARNDKACLELRTDVGVWPVVSVDHRVKTLRGLVKGSDLVVGDVIEVGRPVRTNLVRKGGGGEYSRGFFFGAYLADGHGVIRRVRDKSGSYTRMIVVSNGNEGLLRYLKDRILEGFKGMGWVKPSSVSVRKHKSNSVYTLQCNGRNFVERVIEECGSFQSRSSMDEIGDKRVPRSVYMSEEGMRGFIDGFCNFDTSLSGGSVVMSIRSDLIASGMLMVLRYVGFEPTVSRYQHKDTGRVHWRLSIPRAHSRRFIESVDWVNSNKGSSGSLAKVLGRDSSKQNRVTDEVVVGGVRFARVRSIVGVGVRPCVDISLGNVSKLFQVCGGLLVHNSDYTDEFWNIVIERSNPDIEHSLLLSLYGSQGGGKSWSAISVCSMLDPEFSVDNIFFSYNDLVHARSKLKENSAVLLDEQTQSYGMDSHRVMLIMNSLKEQLRKKSIHLIFCSPVLHEEAKTSMYLLEIMFIDKETEEAVAALYTREGHTLGHVRIPSPLKVLSDGQSLQTKAFMKGYESKKDDHLEKILGQKSVDVFEDRANAVMRNVLFRKAERIYVRKLGYIPRDRVVQIVNMIFPEYNAGVVPNEIAERIRMKKEIEGKWIVPGQRRKSNG